MARYRRSRRFRRRSGRWAANIQEVNGSVSATPGIFSNTESILTNPAQSTTLVTQVFTVKNIEITFNLDFEQPNATVAVTDIEGFTAYIMYAPQGMTITNNYNLEHPEYIMAYKYLGSPTLDGEQQYQPYRIRTRLARKLQSGDNVILFIKGVNQNNNNTYTLRLSGLVRWWTKAN